MSFGDDLDVASDLANIAGFQQREAMLANQVAQLDALRGLQQQAQIQAFQAQREKALQDTLFSLRKSFPATLAAMPQQPDETVIRLFHAFRTMAYLSPTEFSGLEWKELSVTARDELNVMVTKFGETHGQPAIQQLSDLLNSARADDEEKQKREAQMAWLQKQTVQRNADIKSALTGINVLTLFFMIVTACVGISNESAILGWTFLAEIVGAIVVNLVMLSKIRE